MPTSPASMGKRRTAVPSRRQSANGGRTDVVLERSRLTIPDASSIADIPPTPGALLADNRRFLLPAEQTAFAEATICAALKILASANSLILGFACGGGSPTSRHKLRQRACIVLQYLRLTKAHTVCKGFFSYQPLCCPAHRSTTTPRSSALQRQYSLLNFSWNLAATRNFPRQRPGTVLLDMGQGRGTALGEISVRPGACALIAPSILFKKHRGIIRRLMCCMRCLSLCVLQFLLAPVHQKKNKLLFSPTFLNPASRL